MRKLCDCAGLLAGRLFAAKVIHKRIAYRLNERDKREEDEAVSADKRVAFWIDLLGHDATPPDMILRVDPVAFRAFVKAMLPRNSSLRSLDACGSKLHDDVGVQVCVCIACLC